MCNGTSGLLELKIYTHNSTVMFTHLTRVDEEEREFSEEGLDLLIADSKTGVTWGSALRTLTGVNRAEI